MHVVFSVLEVSISLLNKVFPFHMHLFFSSHAILFFSRRPELNPTRTGRISVRHVKPVLRDSLFWEGAGGVFIFFFFSKKHDTRLRAQPLHSDVYIELRYMPLLKPLHGRRRQLCA